MTELTKRDGFERRLETALLDYVADAPGSGEPYGFAADIVRRHPRSPRGRLQWLPTVRPAFAIALLILAIVSVALVAGPALPRPSTYPSPSPSRATSPSTTPGFSIVSAMATGRAAHTATRLRDGELLVTGGYRGEGLGANRSTERFTPITASFVLGPELGSIRFFHTATSLPDGTVLVVGGTAAGRTVPGAQIFDPTLDAAAGGFTPGGELREGRSLHTATLLDDGRVLVAGGLGADGELASLEVWDPATGRFGPAGTLAHARAWHTATKLPDGRVLIAGGHPEAELWDPATGKVSPAGTLGAARWWATATLLDDGSVLLIGGFAGSAFSSDARALASVERWDPGQRTWTPAADLAVARGMHAATRLPDGRILVSGGSGDFASNTPVPLASTELWDPTSQRFAPGPDLAVARQAHTATVLLDGRVVVIGGSDKRDRGIDSSEIWDPSVPWR